MGTQEEEAAAMDKIIQESIRREAAALAAAEEARKAAEAAKQQGQGNMVADPQTAGQGWPDNEVQAPQGKLSQVKGALGLGAEGDLAFAKGLLDAERRPGGAAADQVGVQADGAKARTSGASGIHTARPAFER